jgi:anthranilate phosphoribosyltransferase
MTVHSDDGLDEISTGAKSKICFLKDGGVTKFILDPQELGLHASSIKDLQISSKQDAIKAFLSVLNGTANRSMLEITSLNAAGGLIVANMADSFEEGLEIATQSMKTGRAYSHFTEFVKNYGDPAKIKEGESF